MQDHRAVVIGGGIGGLTAAAALHHRSWDVTVLERAPSVEPVGAGIGLAANAQAALDTFGAGDAVRALAGWHAGGGLRLPGGTRLSWTDNEAAGRRYGSPLVVAHRADLIDLLAARLPDGALRTGTTATLADPGGPDRPARVTTGDGELTAGLVVAADGIHSPTRRSLFPGHPGLRYSGITCWRTVVPRPAAVTDEQASEAHETWGRGRHWGTIPLHDGRLYAYAGAKVPAGVRGRDGELAALRHLFGDWHQPVPAILDAADPAAVLRNEVHTLAAPLPAHHRGRTVLVGDAAHPMLPNLAQGGCQAIEDGAVLALLLADAGNDPFAALPEYTRRRLPRTTEIVRRSARVARLATLSSAPARAVRAGAVALAGRLGPALVLRAHDGIADWRP
ncbi:monooxygenase [Streptomyces mashuensis]|uniref:Monooxygenase n=1 Tax=Streptomyces mashuensis TaxID=33904 RepID=A0A919B9Y0_9ACTN|nr:FAD-dependent monooxygenase [Streptomyces mashuensis]GHF69752.1 monooxygenase [Streptomyces mashuensis]